MCFLLNLQMFSITYNYKYIFISNFIPKFIDIYNLFTICPFERQI